MKKLLLSIFLIACGGTEEPKYFCPQFPLGPYECSIGGVQKTCTLSNRVTTLSSGGNTDPKCWISVSCPEFVSVLDNKKSPTVSVSSELFTITGYTYESSSRVECKEIKD